MRSVELAKIAASAETLRLKRLVRRQGMRGAYGAGAALFALFMLGMLHVVVYHVLTPAYVTPLIASLILLGVDLVVAAVFGLMAKSDKPDAIEVEAKQVRQQALVEMRKATTMMALAGETVGLALRRPRTVQAQPRSGARLAAEIAARLMARR